MTKREIKKRSSNLPVPNDSFTEFLLYTTPNGKVKLEIFLHNENIWLTQDKIAQLFGVQRPAITKHLKNIFESGELEEAKVSSILEHTTPHDAIEGKQQVQKVKFYNLDAIISVGYRVNSMQATHFRTKPMKADYILVYNNIKIGVVEAKSDEEQVGEGIAQAKKYAEKLCIDYTYATNGKEIYQISMKSGKEGAIPSFPTPAELWNKTFPSTNSGRDTAQNDWKDKFNSIPFEDVGGTKTARYYQEIATVNTMEAIANKKQRILPPTERQRRMRREEKENWLKERREKTKSRSPTFCAVYIGTIAPSCREAPSG